MNEQPQYRNRNNPVSIPNNKPPVNRNGSDNMSDLSPLIERMDQGIRDHKKEVREQIAVSEKRNSELLKEIKVESATREERMVALVLDMRNDTKSELAEMKNDIKEIRMDMRSTTKHFQVIMITIVIALISVFTAM